MLSSHASCAFRYATLSKPGRISAPRPEETYSVQRQLEACGRIGASVPTLAVDGFPVRDAVTVRARVGSGRVGRV